MKAPDNRSVCSQALERTKLNQSCGPMEDDHIRVTLEFKCISA